ncbi:MAG: Zn-dependent hydrolase, partial [Leucothrix sp.]
NPDWADIHMLPEESVQAHIDLRGVKLLPVHNSTFDLSFHPWYEPLDRVAVEAKKREVPLVTPLVGEVFTVKQADVGKQWWLDSK